ncbi:MAG: phosphohistidine phosphatase SixA [Leptospirillia bacterium]
MRIYLVRHGQAVAGVSDPPLSDTGRDQAQRLARLLEERGGVVRVVHSGRGRAAETADILSARLCPDSAPEVVEGVDPNDPPEWFGDRVDLLGDGTAVVTHLPFVERLAAYLVTGNENGYVASFDTCTCACMEKDDDGRWKLAWLEAP